MATKVGICNLAIRMLGVGRITAITDVKEQARILNDIYDMIQDEVLSAHPWNFAIKRGSLTELAATPEFGWDHAFQLPTDCLRVIKMEDNTKFVVESDQLLTDESSAKIKYIARITDTTKYSPSFITAFGQRLAAEIAYPLTTSNSITENMYKIYEMKLKMAKSIDAQEGIGQREDDDSWEEART